MNWPEPVADVALKGHVGDYIRLVEPETEADRQALLLINLVELGCAMGDTPYYVVADSRHHTNEFTAIVGESAFSGKQMAQDRGDKLMSLVDPLFRMNNFADGLDTEQGIVFRLSKQEKDSGDTRVLCVEEEFASILTKAHLNVMVRKLWDSKKASKELKTESYGCEHPHVSIIADITPNELHEVLPKISLSNGYANRFLLVMAKQSQVIARPLPLDKMDKNKVSAIVKGLQEAVAFAKKTGEISMESKTDEEIWSPFVETLDYVSVVENRKRAHTARLAMLFALLDKSRVIRAAHLNAAIAVWTYCRDSSRYLFAGHHRPETAEEQILKLLAQHSEGLTTTQITFMAFGNNKAAEPLLLLLEEAGKVRRSKVQGVGRPSVKWFLTMPPPSKPNGSVNSLLLPSPSGAPPTPPTPNGRPSEESKPDVVVSSGFLTLHEADALLEAIRSNANFQQNYIQIYGKRAIPRREAWYGSWDYPYSSGIVLKAAPIPAYLQVLFDKLKAAGFGSYNAVLINRYRNGSDYIGPHSDDDYGDPEPTIPSLTLGATRPFRLAKKAGNKLDKTTLVEYLPGHGDLLVMRGRTNKEWKHWVPKTTEAVAERINLTFRNKPEFVSPSTGGINPFITDSEPLLSIEPIPQGHEAELRAIGCSTLYVPRTEAWEYAPLATYPNRGCSMKCFYCYVVGDGKRCGCIPGLSRAEFDAASVPRKNYLQMLRRDCEKYRAANISDQVLLSFTGDVYNPTDISLTRPTIEMLIEHGLAFCVLTKGGMFAVQDQDLYRPTRDAFACTLTSLGPAQCKKNERDAASPADRIRALKFFHDAGIFTWVSLEPVLYGAEALRIVDATHSYVNHYKVGKLNYLDKWPITWDWQEFTNRMMEKAAKYKVSIYFKKSLQEYLPEGYPNPMRIDQHF